MNTSNHIKVRDLRVKGRYSTDDAYVDHYARLCGVYATAVYASLCRHANKGQESWPSVELLSAQHSISRPTVLQAIKKLEEWGIVQVLREKDETTKRQKVNIYCLLDKSCWRVVPGQSPLPGAESISRRDPGKPQNESRVNDVYWKDTQVKDTHKKVPLFAEDGSDAAFPAFWASYPRKVAKVAAKKAWGRLKPDVKEVVRIMASLEAFKASKSWRKDEGAFIPHPATWLNGRRFEDELPVKVVDVEATERQRKLDEMLSAPRKAVKIPEDMKAKMRELFRSKSPP